MKLTQFEIEGNTIEVINTFFGIEKIMLKGKELSSRWSFTGTNHTLAINQNDYEIKTVFPLTEVSENRILLLKDEDIVTINGVETKDFNSKRFALGGLIGILTYLIVNGFF